MTIACGIVRIVARWAGEGKFAAPRSPLINRLSKEASERACLTFNNYLNQPRPARRMTFRPKGRVRLYGCIAAANHGTTIGALFGDSHQRRDTAARREVWRRLKADGFSLAAIGRMTNRDHSTVLYGLRVHP